MSERKSEEINKRIKLDDELSILPNVDFDFDEIKRHYCQLDSRWINMFESTKCKPFEKDLDKPLNPFR